MEDTITKPNHWDLFAWDVKHNFLELGAYKVNKGYYKSCLRESQE